MVPVVVGNMEGSVCGVIAPRNLQQAETYDQEHCTWLTYSKNTVMMKPFCIASSSTAMLFIILCMCPVHEGWPYIVMSSLIGWVHAQNDPWVLTMHDKQVLVIHTRDPEDLTISAILVLRTDRICKYTFYVMFLKVQHKPQGLTHSGQKVLYGDLDLGQHCLM